MWITDNAWALWLAVILFSLIVEMIFTQVYFLMISGAAVAGLLANVAQASLMVQVIVFCMASIALLILARPWVLGKLQQRRHEYLTNVDALLGESALALEPINATTGLARIGGDVWTARALTEDIPVGATVIVRKIDGATAVVEPTVNRPDAAL